MADQIANIVRRLRRQPIDYGDGLYQLPEERLERSYDTWAADQWKGWSEGRYQFAHGPESGSHCPACHHLTLAEQASYMATAHHDKAATKRWRNIAAIATAQTVALGACRCAEKLTPGEAAKISQRTLGRYGDFRG